MRLSITQNHCDLTWPQLQRIAGLVEEAGFAGIYFDDHYPGTTEPIVKLAHLATTTRSLRLGTLVSPLSVRDPVMLARQAMAIDELSGGRLTLGIGAGHVEGEHATFGYTLGDVPTRMARLEEGAQVITQLIRSPDPVTFEGRFYRLHEAQLRPRPSRPTPIMIGGNGPKKTLPIVAKYADIWNCQISTPAMFKEGNARLDELLHQAGRQPGDVRRTLFLFIVCWREDAELERFCSECRRAYPFLREMTDDQIVEMVRANFNGIAGSPEVVIEQLKAFEAAGADEAMIGYFTLDSTEFIEILARHVLPHFADGT
jgi:alkanesulfonate monooxygenase SsuD/methylene tetrahydromethanopterin reductase-like flavin-dependent oxidoreductase (luciferase family)